ncbi:hypothetical protein LT493_35405 [Streptomyces tricolor]|nr:hypothetical protein [Streptomyces tricolor]
MSAPQEPPPERSPLATFAEKAAYIAAPGTVALGLLYYFGSVYIREYYSALGVVPEDLGMSVQNVMASSTQAVFLPLCLLLAGGLVVFLLVGLLGRALARPRLAEHRRTAIILLLAVGMAMVFVDFPALFSDLAIPFPGGLAQGVPAGPAGGRGRHAGPLCRPSAAEPEHRPRGRAALGRERPGVAGRRGAAHRDADDQPLLRHGAVRGGHRPQQRHTRREAGLRGKPTVVVHSRVLLTHNARDVEFKDHGSGSGPYRYEYRGFQLLAKAPARFYLVSHTARYRDAVVVLPDDGTAWLEIRAPKP